jgi:hypothetical protein
MHMYKGTVLTCCASVRCMGNDEVVKNDWGTKMDFAHMDELDRKTGHILQWENGDWRHMGMGNAIGDGCHCVQE